MICWLISKKEELKSMHDNDMWHLFYLPDNLSQLVANGYTKPKGIPKATLKPLRQS